MRAPSLHPFCAPGSTLAPWALLQSTDQGTAPFDPGSFADTGTVFDPNTGLFTWVMKGDATGINGYNENSARWTKRVVDLYPDFDPATDRLDVCLEAPTIPLLTGAERYGLMLGVLDGAAGASNDGCALGLCPVSATNLQRAAVGETSFAATADSAGVVQRVVGNWSWRPDGARAGLWWWYQIAGVWGQGPMISTASTVDPDPSVWRIHVGHLHNATVSATPTLSAKLYHRRTKTSGLTGLP